MVSILPTRQPPQRCRHRPGARSDPLRGMGRCVPRSRPADPEQEAQIKAGHGIDVTPEENALFQENSVRAARSSCCGRRSVSTLPSSRPYSGTTEQRRSANPCATGTDSAAGSTPARKRAKFKAYLADMQACLERRGIDATPKLNSGGSAGWSFESLDVDSALVRDAIAPGANEAREKEERGSSAPSDSHSATTSDGEQTSPRAMSAEIRLETPDWRASSSAGTRSEFAGARYTMTDPDGATLKSGNIGTYGEAIISQKAGQRMTVTVASKADGTPCGFTRTLVVAPGHTISVPIKCSKVSTSTLPGDPGN